MTRAPFAHSPSSHDAPQHEMISQFRAEIKQAKEEHSHGWELTRKLVQPNAISSTLLHLTNQIQQSNCPPSIQERLLAALAPSKNSSSTKHVNANVLKELTGFPTTKGIRALCLFFDVVKMATPEDATVDSLEIEDFVKNHTNPYDWLLQVQHPSLLDLGAGDLSFEEELLEQYASPIQARGKLLTLHALDRLQPGSQFGGVYHANQERLARFAQYPSDSLKFRFWGATDMLDLNALPGQLNQYSIVTCHAPATPTFAYEPTRLSQETIQDYLKQSKGEFKTVRVHGEEALEVHHRGRTLTFPSWKFVVRGPLALLDLLARKGQLCIVSAIDAEVFWEILAQLVEDESIRRSRAIFTPENLPGIFKELYQFLSSLKEEDRCGLADVTPLRTRFPHVLSPKPRHTQGFRFRYVEIRRGAVFSGMPSSFTAKQFSHMREEPPPWCLILIPERLVS